MNDAMQWLLDLIAPDVALIVGGVLVLMLTLELIVRFRDWTSS